jgi:hypothetical protein
VAFLLLLLQVSDASASLLCNLHLAILERQIPNSPIRKPCSLQALFKVGNESIIICLLASHRIRNSASSNDHLQWQIVFSEIVLALCIFVATKPAYAFNSAVSCHELTTAKGTPREHW